MFTTSMMNNNKESPAPPEPAPPSKTGLTDNDSFLAGHYMMHDKDPPLHPTRGPGVRPPSKGLNSGAAGGAASLDDKENAQPTAKPRTNGLFAPLGRATNGNSANKGSASKQQVQGNYKLPNYDSLTLEQLATPPPLGSPSAESALSNSMHFDDISLASYRAESLMLNRSPGQYTVMTGFDTALSPSKLLGHLNGSSDVGAAPPAEKQKSSGSVVASGKKLAKNIPLFGRFF